MSSQFIPISTSSSIPSPGNNKSRGSSRLQGHASSSDDKSPTPKDLPSWSASSLPQFMEAVGSLALQQQRNNNGGGDTPIITFIDSYTSSTAHMTAPGAHTPLVVNADAVGFDGIPHVVIAACAQDIFDCIVLGNTAEEKTNCAGGDGIFDISTSPVVRLSAHQKRKVVLLSLQVCKSIESMGSLPHHYYSPPPADTNLPIVPQPIATIIGVRHSPTHDDDNDNGEVNKPSSFSSTVAATTTTTSAHSQRRTFKQPTFPTGNELLPTGYDDDDDTIMADSQVDT